MLLLSDHNGTENGKNCSPQLLGKSASTGAEPINVKSLQDGKSDSLFKDIFSSNQGESDRGESELDESNTYEEDLNTVLGVSIGKEQTRFMRPTTPATEKIAAMDDRNNWNCIDKIGDEATLKAEQQSRDYEDLHDQNLTLPSPWTATPKLFEISDEEKSTDGNVNRRSRASTSPANVLPDVNIKRFLSGLSFPALSTQNPFKDLSVHRLPSLFGSAKDSSPSERTIGRPHRSSSLFTQKFSWNITSPNGSLSRGTSSHCEVSDVQIQRRIQAGQDDLNDIRSYTSQKVHREDLDAEKKQDGPPDLRKSTSDTSLQLHRALSKVSSLGDDSRWEHVQGQVNSRMKAIVDSFQDSALKLPSLPSINLSALRPDFVLRGPSDESKGQARESLTNGLFTDSHVANIQGRSFNEDLARSSACRDPKYLPRYIDEALANLTGDVVVMGGYRGSVLRSAEPPHRQLWVPVKVGLNIRKVNLEVGLEPADEEKMENNIFASGMLTHIGPIDISRRLFKRLRSCKNAQDGSLRVHDYGYDWRLSPHLLSRKFTQFLQGLKCNISGAPLKERGATVIAHSLGGLITRHAVNQNPGLFAGVIYAGVPQHCVNILGPLRKGDEVLLSSKVLTAQVNFSLRTSFVLLPESGKCFIDRETREDYPVDFFDVESWKDFCLSPCIAPCLPPLNPPERKSLLGTVSGSLPSLIEKLGSLSPSKEPDFKDAVHHNTESATISTTLAHPQDHTVNVQMSQSQSPQRSSTSTIPLPSALEYLKRTLASTLAFKQELAFQPQREAANTYPPISIIYSTSTPTVYGARVASRDAIKRADAYDNLAFASGDGVVLARAAMVPKGYKVVRGGRVRTERGHVGLLGDLEAVGKCLVAIKRGRLEGTGLAGEDEEDQRG